MRILLTYILVLFAFVGFSQVTRPNIDQFELSPQPSMMILTDAFGVQKYYPLSDISDSLNNGDQDFLKLDNTIPTSINDDIYTNGKVGINTTPVKEIDFLGEYNIRNIVGIENFGLEYRANGYTGIVMPNPSSYYSHGGPTNGIHLFDDDKYFTFSGIYGNGEYNAIVNVTSSDAFGFPSTATYYQDNTIINLGVDNDFTGRLHRINITQDNINIATSNDNEIVFTPTSIIFNADQEIQFTDFPSSRDDSALWPPNNFFYSNGAGNLRSAPLSSISSSFRDHDFYVPGDGTIANPDTDPTDINDDLYTNGKVSINTRDALSTFHVEGNYLMRVNSASIDQGITMNNYDPHEDNWPAFGSRDPAVHGLYSYNNAAKTGVYNWFRGGSNTNYRIAETSSFLEKSTGEFVQTKVEIVPENYLSYSTEILASNVLYESFLRHNRQGLTLHHHDLTLTGRASLINVTTENSFTEIELDADTIQLPRYTSTRDDTPNYPMSNVLYTSPTGQLLSAPASSLGERSFAFQAEAGFLSNGEWDFSFGNSAYTNGGGMRMPYDYEIDVITMNSVSGTPTVGFMVNGTQEASLSNGNNTPTYSGSAGDIINFRTITAGGGGGVDVLILVKY